MSASAPILLGGAGLVTVCMVCTREVGVQRREDRGRVTLKMHRHAMTRARRKTGERSPICPGSGTEVHPMAVEQGEPRAKVATL